MCMLSMTSHELIQAINTGNAGAWLSNATLSFLDCLSSATFKLDVDAVKSKFGLLIKIKNATPKWRWP